MIDGRSNDSIKFIALASIASIDNFYGAALPMENKVKRNFGKGQPVFKNHRRTFKAEDERPCCTKTLAFITKVIRILYASWLFYFMPFLILVLPYLVGL